MMKKIVLIVLGLIVGSVVGLLGYVRFALPNVGPAPVMTIESTPERVERGKYLANHVTVCIDCHSTRDWSKFSGPLVPGAIGKGGELFD
ncbi:MAG TPA: cytochrome C, partial [Leptospiraceae bacterium]|nr:cytochrome C [Leptospiraceae bacterium]